MHRKRSRYMGFPFLFANTMQFRQRQSKVQLSLYPHLETRPSIRLRLSRSIPETTGKGGCVPPLGGCTMPPLPVKRSPYTPRTIPSRQYLLCQHVFPSRRESWISSIVTFAKTRRYTKNLRNAVPQVSVSRCSRVRLGYFELKLQVLKPVLQQQSQQQLNQ